MAEEVMKQDAPTPPSSSVRTPTPTLPESSYPELYLPPHLLHPTCDPSYLAAAKAAHAPQIDTISPLLNVPISSLSAKVLDLEHAEAGSIFSQGGGDRTCYDAQDFHDIFTPSNGLPLAIEVSETLFFSQPDGDHLFRRVFFA